jgi:hypothetical protein
VADINKYEITISSRDTSDPEKAESIKKSLESPSNVVRNQDVIRKEISKFGKKAGGAAEDFTLYDQALAKFNNVLKNAAKGFTPVPTSKTKTSKSDDQTTKDLREAAADNKETSKNLKEVSKNLKKETEKKEEEVKDKKVSVAPVVPTKTGSAKKTALEEYEDTKQKRKGIKSRTGATQEEYDKYKQERERELITEHNKKVAKINRLRGKKTPTQQHAVEPPWQGEEQPPIEQLKPVTKKKEKTRKWDWVASSVQKEEAEAAERAKKEKTKQPRLPARRTTGKEVSLVESSDALMSQIKSDFAKFKERLASTIRTRLQTEHAGGFKVVEGKGKGGAYTRRGGTEVLKIANMRELTNALLKLTNSTEKTASLAKKGPSAMIEHASNVVSEDMITKLGKKDTTRAAAATRQTVAYINKHGYEGSNAAVKELVKNQERKLIEL